jgi:hypothetical protein
MLLLFWHISYCILHAISPVTMNDSVSDASKADIELLVSGKKWGIHEWRPLSAVITLERKSISGRTMP